MGHRALRETPAPTSILRFSLDLRIAKFNAILLTDNSGTQQYKLSQKFEIAYIINPYI
jgi:hypothetical protein